MVLECGFKRTKEAHSVNVSMQSVEFVITGSILVQTKNKKTSLVSELIDSRMWILRMETKHFVFNSVCVFWVEVRNPLTYSYSSKYLHFNRIYLDKTT